jgi:hypothetical protein
MAEQQRGFAPTDPSVEDDLLAPEPEKEAPRAPEEELRDAADLEPEPDAVAAEDDAEKARAPRRQFARMGWAALAVFTVIGVLIVVELVRLSTAVNNNTCVQRAQANFMQAQGPGVTPQYAGLDRLTGVNQLKKCGGQ